MIEAVPYWCRIALLLLLLSLIATIDRLRNGPKATRVKEYSFVVVSGVVGALFGLLNDLITSSISPEYFSFGKGLNPGDGLTVRAGILGMKAGLSAGAIAGAICLYASTRGCLYPPLAYRRLLGVLWRPVVLATAAALMMALFFRRLDPFGFSRQLEGILEPRRIQRFLTVWWIHCGLYLGLLVSVVWIIVDIARLRKRQQYVGAAGGVDRRA
jgi:hypothetical protein